MVKSDESKAEEGAIDHAPKEQSIKPESERLLLVQENEVGQNGTPKKLTKSKENLFQASSASKATKNCDNLSQKLLENVLSEDDDEDVVKTFKKTPIKVSSDNNNCGKSKEFSNHKNAEISVKLPNEKQTEKEKEEEQEGWKRFLGILLALLAAFQFASSALIIKVLGYHPFNLGVWRFLVMALIPIPFLVHSVAWKKQNVFADIWPVRSTTVFLMLQAILGANSIIFVFFGLKYLNIADSIVIGTSAPVFVTLFAFIFLGERCGLFPVITALLALVGVAIISKPPILTGAEEVNEDTFIIDPVYIFITFIMYVTCNLKPNLNGRTQRLICIYQLGVASSFSSMILLTICYVVIRYIRKVNHALVNLCFALWGLLQSVIMANLIGVLEVPKNLEEVGLIVISAFLAFFAQTCITLALKYENAGPVALVRTTEVIFAFFWQAIFLGVQPDIFSIIGAAVTLTGVALTALRKMVMSLPDDHKNKRRFRFLLW